MYSNNHSCHSPLSGEQKISHKRAPNTVAQKHQRTHEKEQLRRLLTGILHRKASNHCMLHSDIMDKVASLAFLAFVVVSHLGLSVCQNCPDSGGRGFVGFTALTPEQLKNTIQESVQVSVSDALSSMNQEDGCCLGLFALNDTLTALVEHSAGLEQTIESAVYTAVVNSVMANVDIAFQSALSEAVQNLTRVVQQLNTGSPPPPPTPQTPSPPPPSLPPPTPPPVTCLLGSSPFLPAASCKLIYNINSSAPSGFYWIGGGSEGPPQRLYCDMGRSCGGVAGGWTRIANVNMTNSSHSCPSSLVEVSIDPKRPRLCTMPSTGIGCSSTVFAVHGTSYEHVCGRIIGYQDRTPNAFFPYYRNRSLTIDDIYLDGVSLTHGSRPRQHIWSFASALDETDGHQSGCPCLNIGLVTQPVVPPFVGDDYFCDTGSADDVKNDEFYADNPLWDGEGCGSQNICCFFNNPPWFSKRLDRSTSDDIEMRICRDAGRRNEDVPLELIELYVR